MSITFKYSNPPDVSYIYDGGGLIHKIRRKTELTYESLFGKYTEYVKNEIWPTKLLFDGHPGGLSTIKTILNWQ